MEVRSLYINESRKGGVCLYNASNESPYCKKAVAAMMPEKNGRREMKTKVSSKCVGCLLCI